MTDLRAVYEKYDRVLLGTGTPEEEPRKRLVEDLRAVRSANERYFVVAVVLLAAFFVASWILIYLWREHPDHLVGVFGTLGGSVFGSVWVMAKLWQRKVATDVVLVLLDQLPPAEFKIAFKAILNVATAGRAK